MRQILAPLLILFSSLSSLAQEGSAQGLTLWGELLGTNPVIEGPNCWNLAVVDMGITSHKRFSSSQEFRESLNTFCKPISAQIIKQGDIGAITYDEAYELHAFVVIDTQRALTKDFGTDDPNENISYRIENIKDTIAPYMKSAETSHLQYYRCDRGQIYFANQALSTQFPQLAQALKQSEEALEKYHWNQTVKENILLSMQNLNQELESTDSKNLMTNLEIKKVLRLRILGLYEGVLAFPLGGDGARLKEKISRWAQSFGN